MSKEKLNEEAVVEETQDCKKELPKKSELLKEQITLEQQYTNGTQEMLEEIYTVKIGSKGNFERLIKMIEHDVEFDHSTATGLALLYSNLKQQKPFTREDDWNGTLQLKTSSCMVLWKILMSFKGHGFFEAKAFLEMIQLIGPEVSEAVKVINDKTASLRGLHTRLNEIYNILDSGDCENDLTEEEEKALLAESQSVIKQEQEIEDEVNPSVEA